MRLLAAFLSHESTTQLRSTRFRVVAVAYIAVALIPVIALYLASGKVGFVLATGAYAEALQALVPGLTALLATVLAVDAISRERDEGSFGVISLAPMSASAYVFCRWLALLVIAVPLTLAPFAISAALSAHANRSMPDLAPLAWEWLLHALPPLVVMSALMLALGTITGRTILAVLAYGAAMTFGLELFQDSLAFFHRHLEGPGDLMGFDPMAVTRLMWSVRGWWQFDPPTAAGYDVETAVDRLLPESALIVACTIAIAGVTPAFLRRTRRDVRPWRIRDDHPLRTMLRGINRIREDYRPDAGLQPIDRIVMVTAVAVAILCIALLLRRDSRFLELAAQRYAAEQPRQPWEMSATLVPRAVRVEGDVARVIRTRTAFDFENRGPDAERQLGFGVHPGLEIERVSASCGKVRVTRVWERVGLELDRAIAPNGTCTVTFDLAGTPDDIAFNLAGNGRSGTRYRRWRDARQATDLSDLSRSKIIPAATRSRMTLTTSRFAPVPRYTPWTLDREPVDRDRDVNSFVAEGILPASDVRLSLRLPDGFTAADSCGTVARGRLDSRCTLPFAELQILAARFTAMPLGGRATLVHLQPHGHLARIHAPVLSEALATAERVWPGLAISGTPVFVERPIEGDGQRATWFNPRLTLIEASRSMYFIPEWLFIRREPLGAPRIAAAIITSTLRSRRPVEAEEHRFFTLFLGEVARARTGSGEQRSAVVSGVGMPPATDPLLALQNGSPQMMRLRGVLVDLEYRVGADRLAESIDEFFAARGTGTAEELLETIGRRANVDLHTFYEDYFTGTSLPKLTIEDASFRRDGSRWIVSGVAHNAGTGEVFCPIVLRTQFGSVRQLARIGSGERVPFTLATEYEPRTLQLDPDHVVYRQTAVGTVDAIDFKGES